MKLAVGSDHGGLELKQAVAEMLTQRGLEVADFGTLSDDSVDYPDFGAKVARAVANGEVDLGVVICGTGIGISISANKIPGIRAALVHDEFTAQMAKEHNNANVLAMGGRVLTPEQGTKLVEIWLDSEYEGGRHQRRLDKITALEQG
ncbi:ribose-5-phosphate isomerase [Malonomonas rubra DSM 5091]|uniref:Ribose-5-phosphate isomerase n=1 Tax=Malonomonas rubra DSM 5091 TaxID=1122189 RepID=A0A1M6DDX3_MALRU|nr:ribose 5-phosphate isomerase B [Malonomonas rubra]SHI71355.1 ribose-5-phosphate isomerase [Malonomonas rubra DSM 5091]